MNLGYCEGPALDPDNGKKRVSNDQIAIYDVNDYERGADAEILGFPEPSRVLLCSKYQQFGWSPRPVRQRRHSND